VARGLDTTLIPARGYPLELISPVPFPRRPGKDMATIPFRARAAVNETAAVLDRLHADVVVGFGGYVALPAYLAARKRKIPIVVHEANAGAGLANKVGARLTPYVFTAGPGIELPHAHPVGIPLRATISHLDRAARRVPARQSFGLDPARTTLLVTGGSQGAQAINAAVLAAADRLGAAGVQVLHIVGPKNDVEVTASAPGSPPYVVVPYVEEMRYAYAAADLVVCRSGAMTVAELSAVGLPAVYVPLPLRGGEQRLNAEPVVAAGGALSVPNEQFDAAWIDANLIPLLADERRTAQMAAAARGTGSPDAARSLAEHVLAVIEEHRLGATGTVS
jgi:UDP-N-acetylglucosamine--N-acetylmuramyl-(pentapeptide) pyrophosphoryl-undecaprenol N-acetylglucosamine transferase